MKKIFILILLVPTFATAQCVDWIGRTENDLAEIETVLTKYLDFNFKKAYKLDKGYAYYNGSSKSSMVRFSFMTKGDSNEKVVSSIYMSGPSAKIDKLINEYFQPTLSPCVKDKASNMFTWGNMILVHDFEGTNKSNAIKTIEIRRK